MNASASRDRDAAYVRLRESVLMLCVEARSKSSDVPVQALLDALYAADARAHPPRQSGGPVGGYPSGSTPVYALRPPPASISVAKADADDRFDVAAHIRAGLAYASRTYFQAAASDRTPRVLWKRPLWPPVYALRPPPGAKRDD